MPAANDKRDHANTPAPTTPPKGPAGGSGVSRTVPDPDFQTKMEVERSRVALENRRLSFDIRQVALNAALVTQQTTVNEKTKHVLDDAAKFLTFLTS